MEENDDNKFEALLIDRRHKELTSALGKVVSELQKKKPDDGIKEAIEKQSKSIEGFSNAIKNLPKPEKPEVNVNVSNDKMVSSINDMCKEICEGQNKILKALADRPLVDKFEIAKYYNGSIRTIKVIYKSENNVLYNKPKAQA